MEVWWGDRDESGWKTMGNIMDEALLLELEDATTNQAAVGYPLFTPPNVV